MTQFNTQPPVNFATGREYKGDNAKILQQATEAKGYTSNEWATLKQWNAQKETVRRNEKGIKITFPGKNGEITASLFNRCQIEE